jgi:hypothetical protein
MGENGFGREKMESEEQKWRKWIQKIQLESKQEVRVETSPSPEGLRSNSFII